MAKTANDFRSELVRLLTEGEKLGFVAVDINAGQLHRVVGHYPGKDHRMPVCCGVMRSTMTPADEIVVQPVRGKGPRLTVRYRLPRPTAK